MEINKEKVKMFVLHFNHPFKKIIGEIHDSLPELIEEPEEWQDHGDAILTMASDVIRVRFPVLCEEMYSGDGKHGTAYLSSIPSIEDTLEFNRSQVLILPFTPTDDYLESYMDMANRLNYPILRKVSRNFELLEI